tara:strand:+ start:11923 stop:12603 length:681 start_codon:yes stop_codon:yes gene_type:complete
MRQRLEEYIKNSATKSLNERREYQMFGTIDVFIKDPLPAEVDLTNIIRHLEMRIPNHLVKDVDTVYVGQFEELNIRQVQAAYLDGAIYVTNQQDNAEDMMDDLIHEFAHAAENTHGYEIYGDGQVEREFLGKRKRLFNILKAEGYDVSLLDFIQSEHTQEMDNFLYDVVGYDKLHSLAMGLFLSPYGATSLREYWANAFEHYYMDDRQYVQQISPRVYEKLEQFTN